jgi:phage repressor protein C with HTH and peptisase S24 domain
MDVIDGEWIRVRLTGERGEMARLARHMGIDQMKLTKVLKGERRVQPEEIPSVLSFFDGGDSNAPPLPRVVHDDDEASSGVTLVNVWDIEARAGHGAVVPEYEAVAYKLAFPPDYLRTITTVHPSNLEIISVKGKSMVPTLDNDDIVMIDRSKRQIGYDGVFVLQMDDTLHVKRITRAARRGFVRIISDNDREFPPFERAVEDIEVIGKVVWAGKRM